jgi:3-hydroxybutyryl-CoA dehydratase
MRTEVFKHVEITDEMVKSFAELSGDRNPIHLDDVYASTTIFKKRIAHGMLVSSFFSTIIAEDYPGNGSIYLEQNLVFLKPCYIGDIVTFKISLIEENNGKYNLQTDAFIQDSQIIKGTAKVLKR